MFFCPNCNNSLSITQQELINTIPNDQTPSELSNTVESESNNQTVQTKPNTIPGSRKAYFKCSNCGYSQEIEPGTMIMSRASEYEKTDYALDKSSYRDMIYDATLPHTRNYICPNKDCKSQKDYNIREAVWFKPNRHTYDTIFVCCVCQTVW